MIKGLLGVIVVVALAAWLLAPPAQRTLAEAHIAAPVRGAIHVHSRRSDGTGTVDEIAAAATRAGLRFVIITDHGDASREPDPAQYRGGVLTIDGVEISTGGGHVIALDLPKSPYPLGGEPRDVLDDIARLGGFAIAAHPGSAKPELRWTDWELPIGGLEWLNADSEWRDDSRWLLLRALFTYPVRRAESVATLLDRPVPVLRQWDRLTRQRRVIGLAGVDAHARVGLRSVGEPYDNESTSIHIPAYEDSFRAFSISLPHVELTGEPIGDAKTVIAAIRAGHVYSTVDAIAGPAAMTFAASSAEGKAVGGDELRASLPVTVRAEVQAPQDAEIVLMKNGAPVATASGTILEHQAGPERAVYRVEVNLPGAPGQPPVPWIVSNPIYVGGVDGVAPAAQRTVATTFAVQYGDGPAAGWTVEQSDASLAAMDVIPAAPGTQISYRFALGGTKSGSPFTALVMPAGSALAAHDRLVFTARADRPLRLSVQLRVPKGTAGERWHRSVYVDTIPRPITVYFDDLKPSGPTSQPRPNLAAVQSVLFVVDTVNASVGSSGRVWIDEVRYGR